MKATLDSFGLARTPSRGINVCTPKQHSTRWLTFRRKPNKPTRYFNIHPLLRLLKA